MYWLVLLVTMPPSPTRNRVGIWRKLKRIGAISLKGAAWVVPETPETAALLDWLLREIETLKGEAALMRVDRIAPFSGEQLADLFRNERAGEYRDVARRCRKLLSQLQRGSARPGPALNRGKAGLLAVKRELDRIGRIDYLHAPAAREAHALYARAAARLQAIQERPVPARPKLKGTMPPAGSTWVTRPRPHIDRMASAWLITRFYDPKARFAFTNDVKARRNTVPFNILGAEFGHHGEHCTYESILVRLGSKDKQLRAIGEIVHEADLRDGKFDRPEAPGLSLALYGLAAIHDDDHELLKAGMAVFDGLYAVLSEGR